MQKIKLIGIYVFCTLATEKKELKTKATLRFMLNQIKPLCARLVGVFLFFLLTFLLFSQGSHIRFNRITINDGLSLSSVYCIFQDSKGFMWFGTEDGLNKYDGNSFTVFRADPNGNKGTSYKFTELIFEDSKGYFWIGSRCGLSRFDPSTEFFTHFFYDESNSKSLTNDTITKITEDSFGNIWIGTVSGLNLINGQNSKVERIQLSKNNRNFANQARINALLPNKDGNVWIGCDAGLFYYDQTSKVVRQISFSSQQSEKTCVVSLLLVEGYLWAGTDKGVFKLDVTNFSARQFFIKNTKGENILDQPAENLHLDKQNVLWAGTPQGLCRFDQEKEYFYYIISAFDSSNSLSINTVKPLFEDSKGAIWYGTFGSGIYKIDPLTAQISQFQNNTADPQSLSENSINCIFEDRAGVMWFGTFGAGISVYDPLAHKFNLIRHNPSNPNSLSSNFIWTVFETSDGKIWIGTNNKGLNCYSPKTGLFTFYEHSASDPRSVASATVRKIFEDSKKNLWIGTDGGGLDRFNPANGTFVHFSSNPNNIETISNNSVRAIYEDRAGTIWVGTRDGLNKFDPLTGKFKRFQHSPKNPESISHNFIYSAILEDKAGNLWIGTYGGGLNKMDIKNETFTHYLNNTTDPNSISDNVVFSVYEDNSGFLWAGTNNGLDRFDVENETFRHFGVKDGLPNDVIYGILPESENIIWLSTNLGVARFDLTNFTCKNFDVNDGLQSNEFNGGAYHKGKSGKMYFGGVYGLNIVDPGKIKQSENLTEVVLTKLDILGKRVQIASSGLTGSQQESNDEIVQQNEDFYSAKSISYSSEIKLSYLQRFVSFEFAALNLPPSENVDYWYKMENMDQDWNYSGSRNYVTYANIKPGSYIFKVTAKNAEGFESKSQANLIIHIAPPFWETWWFVVLEILALAGIAVFIYVYLLKIRTNKLLKIQNLKIQAANQKLIESETKLKDLNTTKDKFFSIIAHDLKNPFTSLLSISELLATNFETLDEEDKFAGVQGFHNSAKRIYALLENLLMWSRAQTGRIKYVPVNFNLTDLAADNINLFLLPAREKGIALNMLIPENTFAWGDPEMIDLVFRNMLHNAIKYSASGSNVTVEIIAETQKVKVVFQDQGIGIPPKNLSNLFTLASNATTNGTSGEKGTGLGLIVCKEFVERHGSHISVQSETGKGSVFSFYLSKGKPG